MMIPKITFVALILILVFFGCDSKVNSDGGQMSRTPPKDQRSQQTFAMKEHQKVTTPLSDDEMHLGACAGEYMWLALVAKDLYSPTDPRAREVRSLAFWFQMQADNILGQTRAIAISKMTSDDLSSRAEKMGMKSLLIECVSRTTDCPPLIIRLKPETARCFELQSDPRVGLTYKFVCN